MATSNPWSESNPEAQNYPPDTDPAYSGQYWGPTYQGQYPTQTQPQYAPYWQPETGYLPGQPPPPPQPPRSPRWLWVVAAAVVLLVAGLIIALVIVSNSSRESTVVAPMPQTSGEPTLPTTPPFPTTRRPAPTTVTVFPEPTRVPAPAPSVTDEPGLPGTPAPAPGSTETVVYSVTGEGRAINITYVDSGGVMQTEFNVALPWSKEVSLAAPAKDSASVAVVNIGRDVTCSVSVDGAQVRQRTGRGLTICTGIA